MKRATSKLDRQRSTDPGDGWKVVQGVLFLAISSIASLLYTIGHLKDIIVNAFNEGRSISLLSLWVSLGPVDALFASLSAAAFALVIYLEWYRRALSRLLLLATPWQGFVLLTIIAAWLGQAYLFPGVLLGGDTGSHLARFLEVREGLTAGTLPQWTNFDYLGSPLLGFTGPLLYVVGGALDILIHDPVITAKILLFTTHLAAGWVFYALLLRLGISRMPAMLAAIGFSGSFAALHLFLFRGVFPQAFTIIGLVLIFYAAEGMMRTAGILWRDWLIFSLSVGGLIVNHQPHALFIGLYLGLFGGASLILGRWDWSRLWAVATAGIAGVGISLVAVVPIIVESSWVMINPSSDLLLLHLPTWSRLLHLISWRDTRTTWGSDYWAYLGIVLVVLAIFGCLSAWRCRLGLEHRRLVLAIAPGLAISFFLYNPVVRDVIFLLFFLGILAALGLEWLARAADKESRMPLTVAIALTLDVASTSVQPVARRDKDFLIEAGQYLARTAPNERIGQIDLKRDGSFNVDIGPGSGPLSSYAMVQRVAGHHNMAATRIHNYAVTILEMAAHDLGRDGRLDAPTLTLLRLLNVTRIICFSPTAAGCPESFVEASNEGPLGRVIHIVGTSPAIFSRGLVNLAPPPGLEKPMLWAEDFTSPIPQVSKIDDFMMSYLRDAGISSTSHDALALPVYDVSTAGSVVVESDPWQPILTRYSVSLQKVEIRIMSGGRGYAQLSHPWYPANEVSINGKPIIPLRGAFDLVVVPIEAGINDIEIHPVTTSVRYYSIIASLSMLFIACLFTVLLAIGPRRA